GSPPASRAPGRAGARRGAMVPRRVRRVETRGEPHESADRIRRLGMRIGRWIFRKETHPTAGELVYRADEQDPTVRERGVTGPRHGEPAYHLADVGLDGAMQLRSRGFTRIDLLERREDQVEELRDPRVLARAAAPGLQRSLHGTTALMTEDHEKRRREVLQRIGQATENLGPYHVPRHPHGEQIAEPLVEHH